MPVIGAVAGVLANVCLVYIAGCFVKDAYNYHKEKESQKNKTKGGNQ